MAIWKAREPAVPELYSEPYMETRSGHEPCGKIDIYRITSEDIQKFISSKVNSIVPGSRAEVVPEYCERKNSRPLRSYAALIIALSAEVIESSHGDIIRQMIERGTDVKLKDAVFNDIFNRYSYNRRELQTILRSYENRDRMEEGFGMTEEYIRNILRFSLPHRQESIQNRETWVIFAAEASKVIHDMLVEVMIWEPIPLSYDDLNDLSLETRRKLKPSRNNSIEHKFQATTDDELMDLSADDLRELIPPIVSSQKEPGGRIEIASVTQIKDNVEFLVYLHVNETHTSDNPELRKIIRGAFK